MEFSGLRARLVGKRAFVGSVLAHALVVFGHLPLLRICVELLAHKDVRYLVSQELHPRVLSIVRASSSGFMFFGFGGYSFGYLPFS